MIIRPSKGWGNIGVRELWAYRELLYFLAWRDIKVRYKQTVLGALWAVIQPVFTMVVFTIFFGRLAGLEAKTGGVPYPVFVFAGLLPWQLFSSIITRSGNSVVGEQNLIKKVYFPRIIIPGAAAGSCLVDFVMSFLVLVCIMAVYGMRPGIEFLAVPTLLLITTVTALGIAMFFSAMNVTYRDFTYVIPFMVQIWMFLSPVIWPVSIVPEKWHWLLALNPMTSIIGAWRAVFTSSAFEWGSIAIATCVSLIIFLLGVTYFRRMERTFADTI